MENANTDLASIWKSIGAFDLSSVSKETAIISMFESESLKSRNKIENIYFCRLLCDDFKYLLVSLDL